MSTEELEAIGEDFYASLNDLTFNSRPIISNLTMIAQEAVAAAPYIARSVERRIEKAVPNQKLFAFYLLDSISKNVGSPYTLLFGQKLYKTFTEAFLLVDDVSRRKFIDLFRTWKSAKTSSGLPLFPEEPISRIEQFLIKASSIYQKSVPAVQKHIRSPNLQTPIPQPASIINNGFSQQLSQAPTPQPSIFTLIPLVDNLLHLTQERQKLNPNDGSIPQRIGIITQLKVVIQSEQMNPQQLLAVKNQLDEMTKFEESFIKKNSPKPSLSALQTFLKPSPSPIPIINDSSKNPLGLLNNVLSLKAPKKKDLSSLISNLEQKGLMKLPSGGSKSDIPSNSVLKSLLSNPAKSGTPLSIISSNGSNTSTTNNTLENPFKAFKLDSKLTSSDPTDMYVKFFITNKPNKCGTCGKRFSETPQGQAERRAHLDWHFRINKRLKESKLIQSRAWYIDDDDYCQFRDWEIFNGGDSSNETAEKIEEKKEKKYVVVPEGSFEMNIVCGICKETIRAVFNDDLGEWIWDGCVMKQGRVFHENCYEESSKNNNSNNGNGTNGGLLLSGLLKREREKDLDFGMLKDIVKNVKLNPTTQSN